MLKENMLLSEVVSKLAELLVYQLLANSFYGAAKKVRSYGFYPFSTSFTSQSQQHFATTTYTNMPKTASNLEGKDYSTLVVGDVNGTLFRSKCFFPYFMLVAFEGGSIIRAFLLLLSYPFIWVLNNEEIKLRVMIFITFCGLTVKDMASVERAVLPKFYLEDLNLPVYESLVSAKNRKVVVLTTMPRVMVGGFLKEYLKVDDVVGTELSTTGDYFTGILASTSGLQLLKHSSAVKEYFGKESPDFGIVSSCSEHSLFISCCKEAYVVNLDQDNNKNKEACSRVVTKDRYPKPLIFHDGRLAFFPTPSATLAMFMWLPLGVLLSVFRLLVGIFLPYKLAVTVGTVTGVRFRFKGTEVVHSSRKGTRGVLYVCTHRTLLDPVMLGLALAKPLTAVTYSLSTMSEFIAPLKTVRLTRDRKRDAETMESSLREGDLVVCPEGTTCREPYLLRFSSLFAELADDIVPVAMNTEVSMFYGTTARGHKWLDSILFLANPRPRYDVNVLGKVPREMTCAGGMASCEVANHIQKQLADALGFECTTFTRKDKYIMLAGNEGRVDR